MGTDNAPGPRERLLDAAQRLTYAHGANVGIDALLAQARVARRSLYEHFGGKDGLLVEVLRRSAAEDLDAYRRAMHQVGRNPRRRLLAVFDYLDRAVNDVEFRGCRYLAADLALSAADHPVHDVTAAYRSQLRRLLRDELRDLGHPRPGEATESLHLLIDGVLARAATRPAGRPGRTARRLAAGILDA